MSAYPFDPVEMAIAAAGKDWILNKGCLTPKEAIVVAQAAAAIATADQTRELSRIAKSLERIADRLTDGKRQSTGPK